MLAPLAFAAMLAVISARGFRGDPVPPDALPAPEHVAPEDPFVARR
jgi:hypothetical protein